MEHSYFKDRISAFLDGELPPYEEQVVGEHLAGCEECQQIKAELEKIDSLVEKYSDLDDDEYWEKSAQKIEDAIGISETQIEDITPGKKSNYKGLGWKLATVAASIAVLTFIGLHEKDIFKEIDTVPTMQAPSISLPPTESREKDDLVFDDEVMEESAIKKAAPVGKTEGIDNKELEKPKIGMPTPVVDEYLKPDTEKETVVDKGDSITSIDDLLSQTAGVVTNTQGEVFIRGGRAGEVDYIVDGVPESEVEEAEHKDTDMGDGSTVVDIQMAPKTTDLDKTISVTSKQDQLKVYETANQTTITREDIESDSARRETTQSKHSTWKSPSIEMEPDVVLNSNSPDMLDIDQGSLDSTLLLAESINRKDSLLALWQKMSKDDKKLKITSSLQKRTSIDLVEKQLLQSYYDLAVIAKDRDEEEYNSAVEFLQDYAKDSQSRSPIAARNYLKRLGIID